MDCNLRKLILELTAENACWAVQACNIKQLISEAGHSGCALV